MYVDIFEDVLAVIQISKQVERLYICAIYSTLVKHYQEISGITTDSSEITQNFQW